MKRILVCLDASLRAPFVLETASDMARRLDAKLCLLRTIGLPPAVDQEAVTHAATGIMDELSATAKGELEALTSHLPAGMVEAVHIRFGTPWDTICHEAKELDCDLVILGSHGYSGFDKILGTTAGKVVNHCDRSVLVARQRPGATT